MTRLRMRKINFGQRANDSLMTSYVYRRSIKIARHCKIPGSNVIKCNLLCLCSLTVLSSSLLAQDSLGIAALPYIK